MKFMCKYCNKSYSCGKALGGHLSSHQMVDGGGYNEGDDDAQGYYYYSLRKKVKGSGMEDSSSVALHLHHVCKECGKGFRSLKALCGHMACHSDKERQRDESQAAECTETVDSGQMQQPRRRSKRMLADGFSVISVEEVARCLMMMSKDRRDATDDSGSQSIQSEDKPPSSGGYQFSSSEPKQRYKNLDTLKGGGYAKKIKRGIAMDVEEDCVAVSNAKKRDNSRHDCPICFRVFKSGQAMGGHKRSHFLQGGVEEATGSVTEEAPMIDLNFSAFVE